MSEPSLAVDLRHQITNTSEHLYKRLNALLATPNLKRVRIAAAYARWDGIGLIATSLETLLKAGGEFQCIYGVNNGVTTPDSFLYSLYLRELYSRHTYSGSVEDKFANAIFHPKFFEFKFADRVVAIIGSANLTGGGLVRNTELCLEVDLQSGHPLITRLETAWDDLKAESDPITITAIRALRANQKLSSESAAETSRPNKEAKPVLKTSAQAAPKPLFEKFLGVQKSTKKTVLLKKLDPLTQKPKKLYLQILETETGGQGGHEGYQIQLPTATLPAYFGVGPDEGKYATFHFGSEVIKTHFTHFYNNTHRLRLKPILNVQRPAVLEFERVGPDEYRCKMIPKKNYATVLASKCTQQTRANARRWGME